MQTTSVLSNKPLLVQIFQKRGEALVKRRQKLFLEPAVVVEVRVPVWTRVIDSATPINGDKPHAGFDESSCQEETLCVFMSAVAISNPVRLRANIKSPAHCFRGQQRERRAADACPDPRSGDHRQAGPVLFGLRSRAPVDLLTAVHRGLREVHSRRSLPSRDRPRW